MTVAAAFSSLASPRQRVQLGALGLLLLILVFPATPVSAEESETGALDALLSDAEQDLDAQEMAAPATPLEWSAKPGVYEGELRRRNGNPFYVLPRRVINETELRAAKRLDADRSWQALDDFVTLLNDKQRMARQTTVIEMDEALRRVDAAILLTLETRGVAYPLAARLIELRGWLLGEWSAATTDNPDVLEFLAAQSDSPFRDMDSPAHRLILEFDMNGGPIHDFEKAAALLSEDQATIEQVVAGLEQDELVMIAEQSAFLFTDVEREGIVVEGMEEKVAVITNALEETSGGRVYPAQAD